MNWMESAWNKVDVTTISKCFAMTGFSKRTSEAPGDENDDLFADLYEDFQSLIDQVAPEFHRNCTWGQTRNSPFASTLKSTSNSC